jgi:tRNA(Ile)-lysidine synthetase-like protein
MLERFQPRLRSISLRAAEILAAEKSCLQNLAADWLRERSCPYEDQPEALQREIVHLQLIGLGVTATTDLIDGLRLATVPVTGPGGRLLCRNASGTVSFLSRVAPEFLPNEQVITLRGDGVAEFGGLAIRWDHLAARGEPRAGTEFLDGSCVGESVLLRHWRPGDRFRQIGTAQAAKLQDLFTNAKVPAGERRKSVVAVNANGTIFWVEGLRVAEEFKVRRETRDVLRWNWRRS